MRTILMFAAAAAMVSSVQAADIVRYPLGGGSTFPIARAVEIPAGFKLIFHSGFTPQPADPKAQENTPAYWGDTRTQAVSALKRLEEWLKSMGLGFADVVKMNVFLVGEPGSGKMDFKGFMEAYTQFFGTREQPNLPARSAVQVAALAVPGMLVEIEVVLATQAH